MHACPTAIVPACTGRGEQFRAAELQVVMSDLMRSKIEFPCPDCSRKVRATIGDVKGERTVRCSGGHGVRLKDEGRGAAKLDRAVSDLQRKLRNLKF